MKQPDEHIIHQLLEKHAEGLCTPEERAVLEQWYASFPEAAPAFNTASARNAVHDDMKAALFTAMAAETPAQRTVVRRMAPWKVAAAILLPLAAGLLVFLLGQQRAQPPKLVEISARKGEATRHIRLPDQSEVWLEPGATLQYREDFNNGSRDVALVNGIAHFDVKQHSEQPFRLSAPYNVQVTVLGTAFTVQAYTSLPDLKVQVQSGAVQVSRFAETLGVLKAGGELLLNAGNGRHVQQTGTETWRAGQLVLDGAPIATLARVLEDRFDVKVDYDTAALGSYRFHVQIEPGSALPGVLKMLRDISGLRYSVNGKLVIIRSMQP